MGDLEELQVVRQGGLALTIDLGFFFVGGGTHLNAHGWKRLQWIVITGRNGIDGVMEWEQQQHPNDTHNGGTGRAGCMVTHCC